MGDGLRPPAGHDRRDSDEPFWEGNMLQWKPRLLLTLLVVALLIAIAFVSGYSEFFNFLEW
jgi:hypothetical protein